MRKNSPKLSKMLKGRNIPFFIAGIIILAAAVFFINKFILHQNIQLRREKGGNINVLILGRGGGTHDGPDLTDTMILAMINPSRNTADMVSVPRDLWVPQIKGKINLAYAQGQKDGKGILLSKAVVEKVLGQNIDYVVVIDFSGFVKLIDYLGGVDVKVAHTLDDYNYPIEGKETDTCGHPIQEIQDFIATGPAEMEQWKYFDCRYKHLHVDAGMQHMNGELALEFSRSRHGIGSEGTDFARSRRQQEVISAVKDKVLSLGIIINPVKVIGIFNILKDNIDTDVSTAEIDDFINLARKMQKAKISSNVIDFGNEADGRPGLLIEAVPVASKGFAYNLEPRIGDGNFTEINQYVACIAAGNTCTVGEKGIISATPTPKK